MSWEVAFQGELGFTVQMCRRAMPFSTQLLSMPSVQSKYFRILCLEAPQVEERGVDFRQLGFSPTHSTTFTLKDQLPAPLEKCLQGYSSDNIWRPEDVLRTLISNLCPLPTPAVFTWSQEKGLRLGQSEAACLPNLFSLESPPLVSSLLTLSPVVLTGCQDSLPPKTMLPQGPHTPST